MVERKMELRRRYHRKTKMAKLKAKLATATGPDRDKIIYKIKRLSPWWTEGGAPVGTGEKKASAEKKPSSSKPKAPPKPRPEKK